MAGYCRGDKMNPLVIFSTKTWQGDYEKIIEGGFNRKYQSCDYPFIQKWLWLNNIEDYIPDNTFETKTDADLIIKTEKLANEVMESFGVNKETFKGGYWYSIQEMCELMLAASMKADYLVHYSSDALQKTPGWITEGIKILENDKSIHVVSPYSEVNTWGDTDQFFSDQCYLIRPLDFYEKDFAKEYVDISDYPAHGGNSFEKIMAQIMRENNMYRKILNNHWYEHEAW
jgi:hypothetical protein